MDVRLLVMTISLVRSMLRSKGIEGALSGRWTSFKKGHSQLTVRVAEPLSYSRTYFSL